MSRSRNILVGALLGIITLIIIEICIILFIKFNGYSITLAENNKEAETTIIIPTITMMPTNTQRKPRIGEYLLIEGLKITPTKYEITNCFTSQYGTNECPPEGAAFLWINIKRENIRSSDELPIYSCFTFRLLYKGEELQPSTYAIQKNRENWGDGGCKELYASQYDEGWIYFQVPEGINLNEVMLRITSYMGPEFISEWSLN
jgi:hypothetical protein